MFFRANDEVVQNARWQSWLDHEHPDNYHVTFGAVFRQSLFDITLLFVRPPLKEKRLRNIMGAAAERHLPESSGHVRLIRHQIAATRIGTSSASRDLKIQLMMGVDIRILALCCSFPVQILTTT